jgi:hypothetical protein
MRHKFLGTGDAGYHPLRKILTVFSGLRYAVLYDWSVTYKLIAWWWWCWRSPSARAPGSISWSWIAAASSSGVLGASCLLDLALP